MFPQRLKELRNNKKLTQSQLGETMNVSYKTVGSWERGERQPSYETAKKIANYFNVSTDYLLGISNVRKSTEVKQVEKDDWVSIPVVGTIKCGPGGIIYEDIEGFTSYPKSDLDSSHEYVVLNATGDSMIGDGINAGDLALIQKEPDFVQGKIYAVIVDSEEATLKRVTRTNDSVILSPSNPKYEPRIITGLELEMFQIIGRLINIKRNYY